MQQVNGEPSETMTNADILINYASYSASPIYELVLFFLALWAGIQCSREDSSTNSIGARRLRLILVKGNAVYFLGWVSSLVHHVLTDIRRMLILQAIYLMVFLTSSVRHRLSHETTNPTMLVASIFHYHIQWCSCYIRHCRLSSHLAYSNCSCGVGF